MVNYEDMTVTIGDSSGQIDRFETWWMTPFGLCQNIATARDKLNLEGIPLTVLKPVTVAFCSNGLYEPLL